MVLGAETNPDRFKMNDRDFALYLKDLPPQLALNEGIAWFAKNNKAAKDGLNILVQIFEHSSAALALPDAATLKDVDYGLDQATFAKKINATPDAKTAIAMGLEFFKRNNYGKNYDVAFAVFNKIKIAMNQMAK